MVDYPHFVPFLNPAPPPGYQMDQFLPLDGLKALLDRSSATIDIQRLVILEGEVIQSTNQTLTMREGVWDNPGGAEFRLSPVKGSDWSAESPLAYLETSVTARDARFAQLREPSFYTIYSGPDRKSFLSDSSMKMAHPAVIKQVAAYGKWAEGYPACVVDPHLDAGESVILINPYERPAMATLEIEHHGTKRFKVPPLCGRRIDIRTCLDDTALPWHGQIYVTGPRRVVAFFVNHSLEDPTRVINLEHTDPYRGESLWVPFTRALHWQYRTRLGLRLR